MHNRATVVVVVVVAIATSAGLATFFTWPELVSPLGDVETASS